MLTLGSYDIRFYVLSKLLHYKCYNIIILGYSLRGNPQSYERIEKVGGTALN